MNTYGLMFGLQNISREELGGKRILEAGALDVNGSLRSAAALCDPAEYVGVDIARGRGVDRLCDVTELVAAFGAESFDVVICTELLEHVRDWRAAVRNIKGVCRKGGIILITTRSRGFEYHGFPSDYWRYDDADMKAIFSDCAICRVEKDPEWGVCVKVRKPHAFVENDLAGLALYSVVTGRRSRELCDGDFRSLHFKLLMFKRWLRFFLCRKIGDRLIPG